MPDPRRDRRRGLLPRHPSVVVAGTCPGVAGLVGSAFVVVAGHTAPLVDHIGLVAGRTGLAVGHSPGLAGMDWASLGSSRCWAPGYCSSLLGSDLRDMLAEAHSGKREVRRFFA